MRKKDIKKSCIICKKEFFVDVNHSYAECCSKECNNKKWENRNREYRNEYSRLWRESNKKSVSKYHKQHKKKFPFQLRNYRKKYIKEYHTFVEIAICPKCKEEARAYNRTTINKNTGHIRERFIYLHSPSKNEIICHYGK